jgi:hypothetical protein
MQALTTAIASNSTQTFKQNHQTIQPSKTTYPILFPDFNLPNCDPGSAAASMTAIPGPLTVSVER